MAAQDHGDAFLHRHPTHIRPQPPQSTGQDDPLLAVRPDVTTRTGTRTRTRTGSGHVVVAAAATAAAVDPRLLMVPAAISASCAFMLPVATAPNAIVFGTEKVTTSRMAREGFALNLLGGVAITLVCYFMLPR